MFGENKDTCGTCGRAYLTGCVLGGECPDCESKRATLERAGWKRTVTGVAELVEAEWEDPKFPGTTYMEGEALKIQEGRDVEEIQAKMKEDSK